MKVLPMNVLPRNVSVQKVMRAEYVMLRTPLVLLDERVLVRLGADSKLRTTVEHGISTLDAVAARFLTPPPSSGEETEPERGGTEPERGETGPDHEDTADDEQIPAEEVHELAEELFEQQEQEHNLAGELAEDEELRRVQAELMAKHRVEEEQQTGRGAEPG